MSDFIEIAREFGPWAAITAVLLVFAALILYYVKTKIDAWGEPWVRGQIKHTEYLTESTKIQATSFESQAKSMESLAKAFDGLSLSYSAIAKAIEQQTISNRLVAGGLSQFVDASKGVTKEHVDLIEFNLRKLEEHVLHSNIKAGEDTKEESEMLTPPKLQMEPLLDEKPMNVEEELRDIKEELKDSEEEK